MLQMLFFSNFGYCFFKANQVMQGLYQNYQPNSSHYWINWNILIELKSLSLSILFLDFSNYLELNYKQDRKY